MPPTSMAPLAANNITAQTMFTRSTVYSDVTQTRADMVTLGPIRLTSHSSDKENGLPAGRLRTAALRGHHYRWIWITCASYAFACRRAPDQCDSAVSSTSSLEATGSSDASARA
jgi:hypothetical protein